MLSHDSFEQLTGIIEADEMYVGGSFQNKHVSTRRKRVREGRAGYHHDNKTPVFGMIQAREVRVRARVLRAVPRSSLFRYCGSMAL